MTDGDDGYEVTEIKAIRGTESRAIASKEKEGWELVSQQSGRLRTTMTFRRPKPQVPWRMLAAVGGAGVVLAGLITVGALLQGGSDAPTADPVETSSTEQSSPVPTTTRTTTTTVEPPPPELEPVVLEEDPYVAPAPLLMQPEVDTPPVQQAVPEPEPVVQAPPPPPAPPVGVYYENCDAVRSAGAAPLYEGSPGYRLRLDRNKDGVACE